MTGGTWLQLILYVLHSVQYCTGTSTLLPPCPILISKTLVHFSHISVPSSCYYCFKIIMIFYYREIHYNAHPDTPMPNICCFSNMIISILIKSIASIFLGIFPILFLSQFYIRPPPPLINICPHRSRPFSACLPLSWALGEGSGKAGGRTERCI